MIFPDLLPDSNSNLRFLEQLQNVVNKFNVSLKACIAHEKSVLETEFRKQIQEELEQNEEKYRTVVDNIGEGLIITDLDDKLIFINETMCKLTGLQSEEVLGIEVCEMWFAYNLPAGLGYFH